MGLDIYCHRIKKSVLDKNNLSIDSDYDAIREAIDKEALKTFKRQTSARLKMLRAKYETDSPCEYAQTYLNFILGLKKNVDWYKIYTFHLNNLGYEYYTSKLNEIKTPDEVEVVFNTDKERIYSLYNAYFRKVNFLYEYFRSDLVDESCIVTKQRILDLINTCKDVLEHKGDEDYAKEHLPTTSGFFFGSTEYNEGYWYDVKDCLKQMNKLYKSMKDDEDLALWDFSW